MDLIQNFIDFLSKNDIAAANPAEIIADDGKHRYAIVGDKAKTKSGSYQLKIDGDFAVGWAISFKEGYTHKYHSKSSRKLSVAERAEYKQKLEELKAAKTLQIAQDHKIAADQANEIWNKAAKTGTTPYLERKDAALHQKARIMDDVLIVPVYVNSKITSVQRIYPNGDKFFLENSQIEGGYFPMASTKEDLATIGICEGYATGDSIRRASGLPVIVAFNSGNLPAVTRAIRGKYPDARIIVFADNDQWTKKPSGQSYNPGIEKAIEATRTLKNATYVWPEVSKDDPNKPTDFNDVGDERIMRALEKASITNAAGGLYPESMGDSQSTGSDFVEEPFRILGHDNGVYYFLPQDGGQIVGLSTSAMSSINNLFRLASLEFWEKDSPEISHKKLAMYKSNILVTRAHHAGVFRPTNVRGVGAWIDDGKKVLHCGDMLLVEDQKVIPHEFKSKYVYPMAYKAITPSDEVLSSREASKLREICGKLSWESPLSGELLAGWCVIAPICAALNWRPHIWVTGESQSGKTTIMEKIIKPLVGAMAVRFDGGTTEAAIRQNLGYDGRPVIMDECESETPKDRMIMEGVLQLARRASSGGTISKGTASGVGMEYTVRSAFCFSGINPVIKHRADESRITQLILRKSKLDNADEFYKELSTDIRNNLTREYGHKMLNRTFKYLDVLLYNCDIFADAAAEVLCDRRAADQIGAMLAGLFLLTSTKRVEFQSAVDWIERHDWKLHTAIDEQNDPERLVMAIMTKFIKTNSGKEDTIGAIMKSAIDGDESNMTLLRKYGIWPKSTHVLISNISPNLEKLLSDTVWTKWRRTLGDIPGAEAQPAIQFANGLKHRCTKIPIEAFDIENHTPQPELDIEVEL